VSRYATEHTNTSAHAAATVREIRTVASATSGRIQKAAREVIRVLVVGVEAAVEVEAWERVL
jgi:hypothetical protein